MSRVYFIHDAQGDRKFEENELPLPIGGRAGGGVVLPGVPDDGVVAHIGLSEGHAFVQPAESDIQLFHNHEHLNASKWLKSGDLVEVGDAVIHWIVQGDQVDISVRRRPAAPVLEPPTSPPPPLNNGTLPELAQAPVRARPRGYVRTLLFGIFLLLLLGVVFVLLATPVVISITPEPERQSLEGFPPAVPFGGRRLVLPGTYTVVAESPGYYPLHESVLVASEGLQTFEFELRELPGRVDIDLEPDVPFKLSVNGEALPVDTGETVEIPAGKQRLRIETERYLPVETVLDVVGKGQSQRFVHVLQPAWANVRIASEPAGAELRIGGQSLGKTPLQIELLQGEHELEMSLKDHKPMLFRQQIQAGRDLDLGPFRLQPLDGRLSVSSVPPGASISVDGVFLGTAPADLALTSNIEHTVQLSKPGYQVHNETITLDPDAEKSLEARLQPQYGIVFVTSEPADASLKVDGRDMGRATQRLRLTTRAHKLVFSKPGYVSRTVSVTPRAGTSKNVDVKLATVAQSQRRKQVAATPATKRTPAGQRLQLVRPQGVFRMGASRREPGRRANESVRKVKLVRPFYLAGSEVSNVEFRQFRPSHGSGFAEGVSLNGEDQPVVNVTWEDAARYCNWLSKKEGLPKAYEEVGGGLKPVRPMNSGYRLPTEAEWAYVARKLARDKEQRYPWSGGFPPTAVTGNFADASIADTLANTVPNYNDGYRTSAPVRSFAARPAGFHDLGGNVAEWVHDYYAVYPGEAEKLVTDPPGPISGAHHVVRDSSWRLGTITELRLSYRDYSRVARPDLGFRVARYAQ